MSKSEPTNTTLANDPLAAAKRYAAQLENDLAQLTAKVEEQRRANRVGMAHAAEVQSNLVQRQEEIAQAWVEVAQQRERAAGLERELAEQHRRNDELAAQLVDANGWVFRLAGERRKAEIAAARVNRQTVATQAQIARLDREVHRAARAYDGYAAERADLLAQIATARADATRAKVAAAQAAAAQVASARTAAARDAAPPPPPAPSPISAPPAQPAIVAMQTPPVDPMEITRLTERLIGITEQRDREQRRAVDAMTSLDTFRRDHRALTQQLSTEKTERQKLDAKLIAQLAEKSRVTDSMDDMTQRLHTEAEDTNILNEINKIILAQPWWWAVMPEDWRLQKLSDKLLRRDIFDAQAYQDRNPDVAASGMAPLRHFLMHGRAERRPRC